MRSIHDLTWPDTFGQRFLLALVINLLIACVATLVAAIIWGPLLVLTLGLWVIAAVVFALITAGVAKPGESFWKPLLR